MLSWLTETDVRQCLNLSHDALVDMIFSGELKAYPPSAGNKALKIPTRQTWEKKEVTKCPAALQVGYQQILSFLDVISDWKEPDQDSNDGCDHDLCDYYHYRPFGNIDLSVFRVGYANTAKKHSPRNNDRGCLDAFADLLCPPRANKKVALDSDVPNYKNERLLAIIKNKNVHISIRRLALSSLLPQLRFAPADIEELHQSLFRQATTPQSPPDPHHDTPAQTEHPVPKKAGAVNFFIRVKGDYWHIGFEGKEVSIKHLAGLAYIFYLLARPGKTYSCIDLYLATNLPEGPTMTNDQAAAEGLYIETKSRIVHKGSENKAKNAIWQKFLALQEDLEHADSGLERQETQDSIDKILESLNSENKFSDSNKKAQIRIWKCLDYAYKAIGKKEGMKKLAKHLRDNIKPDKAYGYSYTGPLTWDTTL